jgi:hypothetical protein
MTDPHPVFDRHFTLAEANALLPWVGDIFRKVDRLLSEGPGAAQPAVKKNGHANGHSNGHSNGHDQTQGAAPAGGIATGGVAQALAGLSGDERLELVNALLAEIIDRGIVIQDPRRGLIDFPAWNNGQEIFLCHEHADGPAIRAWHALHAGFAGRRPIAELTA